MLSDFKHRFAIFDPDKVDINAVDLPVQQDKRNMAADFPHQRLVMAVSVGVEQRSPQVSIADVAQMLGFPRRILFFRPDLAPQIQKDRMVAELH